MLRSLAALGLLMIFLPAAHADDAALATLFDQYLKEEFQRHPAYASSQGNRDHDDRLDDLSAAARWLGRRYAIRGSVQRGAQRGRTIGFPTANLGAVGTLLPKDGVYAVRVKVDEVGYAGAANIGPNPTFGDAARKIEVHLLDFEGDLYGQEMTVEFAARLRDTRAFATVAELVAQLQQDVALARYAAEV